MEMAHQVPNAAPEVAAEEMHNARRRLKAAYTRVLPAFQFWSERAAADPAAADAAKAFRALVGDLETSLSANSLVALGVVACVEEQLLSACSLPAEQAAAALRALGAFAVEARQRAAHMVEGIIQLKVGLLAALCRLCTEAGDSSGAARYQYLLQVEISRDRARLLGRDLLNKHTSPLHMPELPKQYTGLGKKAAGLVAGLSNLVESRATEADIAAFLSRVDSLKGLLPSLHFVFCCVYKPDQEWLVEKGLLCRAALGAEGVAFYARYLQLVGELSDQVSAMAAAGILAAPNTSGRLHEAYLLSFTKTLLLPYMEGVLPAKEWAAFLLPGRNRALSEELTRCIVYNAAVALECGVQHVAEQQRQLAAAFQGLVGDAAGIKVDLAAVMERVEALEQRMAVQEQQLAAQQQQVQALGTGFAEFIYLLNSGKTPQQAAATMLAPKQRTPLLASNPRCLFASAASPTKPAVPPVARLYTALETGMDLSPACE